MSLVLFDVAVEMDDKVYSVLARLALCGSSVSRAEAHFKDHYRATASRRLQPNVYDNSISSVYARLHTSHRTYSYDFRTLHNYFYSEA